MRSGVCGLPKAFVYRLLPLAQKSASRLPTLDSGAEGGGGGLGGRGGGLFGKLQSGLPQVEQSSLLHVCLEHHEAQPARAGRSSAGNTRATQAQRIWDMAGASRSKKLRGCYSADDVAHGGTRRAITLTMEVQMPP